MSSRETTRAGSRKLQDLLVDRKVPRSARSGLAVLAAGDDPRRVLWVEQVGRAADLAPATTVAPLGVSIRTVAVVA